MSDLIISGKDSVTGQNREAGLSDQFIDSTGTQVLATEASVAAAIAAASNILNSLAEILGGSTDGNVTGGSDIVISEGDTINFNGLSTLKRQDWSYVFDNVTANVEGLVISRPGDSRDIIGFGIDDTLFLPGGGPAVALAGGTYFYWTDGNLDGNYVADLYALPSGDMAFSGFSFIFYEFGEIPPVNSGGINTVARLRMQDGIWDFGPSTLALGTSIGASTARLKTASWDIDWGSVYPLTGMAVTDGTGIDRTRIGDDGTFPYIVMRNGGSLVFTSGTELDDPIDGAIYTGAFALPGITIEGTRILFREQDAIPGTTFTPRVLIDDGKMTIMEGSTLVIGDGTGVSYIDLPGASYIQWRDQNTGIWSPTTGVLSLYANDDLDNPGAVQFEDAADLGTLELRFGDRLGSTPGNTETRVFRDTWTKDPGLGSSVDGYGIRFDVNELEVLAIGIEADGTSPFGSLTMPNGSIIAWVPSADLSDDNESSLGATAGEMYLQGQSIVFYEGPTNNSIARVKIDNGIVDLGPTVLAFGSAIGNATETLRSGVGSPEGVISASPGSLYLNRSGGNGVTLYVKSTGTGDTGWRAVVDAAP